MLLVPPRLLLMIAVLAAGATPGPAAAAAAPSAEAPAAAEASPLPYLGEIVVTGNDRTQTQVILRLMDLRLGQPFSLEAMDAAWDALEDSGHFQFVDMTDEEDEDGRVTLHVDVAEDLATYYGPLIRFSRRHKYLLGGWLEERNLRGRAETLRLEAAAWRLQMGRASWHRPWLAGVRGLEATVAAGAEQGEFVFRPTRYRKWDAGLELRWYARGPVFVTAGAAYGHFRQRDPFTWPAPDRGAMTAAGDLVHPAAGENHWRLDAGLGLDTRDNPYYPRRGEYLLARVRRWESNAFAGYTETSLDARLFLPLPGREHILALRGWGRRVDAPAQLDNVLFLGGAESVRGYRFGSLEGDEGWLLTAEYRVPLFLMPISPQGEMIGFGLHLFADAGQAWYEGADPGRPAQSWGAGAHLNLDAWQLRFEAARTRDGDWRFEFMDSFNF